jgi:hypothetical protein
MGKLPTFNFQRSIPKSKSAVVFEGWKLRVGHWMFPLFLSRTVFT